MTSFTDQTPFYRAIHEPRYFRKELLQDLEQKFSSHVVVYMGCTGPMCRDDIAPFEDAVYGIPPKDPVLLILHTTGGDPNVAVKMASRLRESGRTLKVAVPEHAKSAGTLLCLSADSILMGPPSELGPIDPQILIQTRDGNSIWRPAHSVVNGFESILTKCEGNLNPALLAVLSSIDVATLDWARKTIIHAESEATKLLTKYMHIEEASAKMIAGKLSSVDAYPNHGCSISRQDALGLGLKVELLEEGSTEWDIIWRYYAYCRVFLGQNRKDKLFESAKASLAF